MDDNSNTLTYDIITIDVVEQAFERFKKATDRAGQHTFFALFIIHTRLKAMYDDLHKNWDVEHAKLFLKHIENVIEQIG